MAVKKFVKSENFAVGGINSTLYGPPGVGKTTLANTALNPVMWDIEKGAGRAVQGEDIWQVDCYEDMLAMLQDPELAKYKTIIIDTADAFCQKVINYMVINKAKWPEALVNSHGYTLSSQGYMQLGRMFQLFFDDVAALGKDIIFIAHEKQGNRSAGLKKRPLLTGNVSYTTLMQAMTLVGYVSKQGGEFQVDFTINDVFESKDSGALGLVKIGNLDPTKGIVRPIMAEIIEATKRRLSNTKTAGTVTSAFVAGIKERVAGMRKPTEFNALVAESATWDISVKKEAKQAVHDAATLAGLFFDPELKGYREAIPLEDEPDPTPETPKAVDQNKQIAAFIDTIAGIDKAYAQKLYNRVSQAGFTFEDGIKAIAHMQEWLGASAKKA